MAPNPACVDIGGVSIATCSIDSLMVLGAAELASAPQPGAPRQDRMLRLASHVLKQRLFLPLLPPPPDLPVDVSSNLRSGRIGAMPDILILPSQLAPFAKLMPPPDGGALCLNPGKLARNAAGGSFALLSVHPRAQIDGARTCDIGVRTAVQIVKI
jgi:DNA polymerase alpha subunit B